MKVSLTLLASLHLLAEPGKAIFTLEALHREIYNLRDNKTIGVDKACPIILMSWHGLAALSRPLLIIFQKSFFESIVPYQ